MRRNFKYYLAGSIALITFFVYLTALRNKFVNWDDDVYVWANPYIRSFNMAFFKWVFLDFYVANWHPLTWLSHAADYALWGLNPLGHHLTNIILHAANTYLVVLLIIKLLDVRNERLIRNELTPFTNERSILTAAGVTGLLFGLHPVHVESVAWVAERKDLLCALFFLLSLVMYTKYAGGRRREEGKHETGWKLLFTDRNYLLALAFFVLSLLSKPMAVSLPVVLLVLDWYPFQRIYSGKTFRSALVEKMPFAGFALASSIVTILAQKAVGALIATQTIPLSSRMLVAAKSLISYLSKMALPYNLIPFYSYPGPSDISLYHLEYPLSIAVVIGITAACAALMKKQKLWLSSWGYYVVTLLPVLGIVQVGGQAMADRYTYLPSLGPFLIAGLGAAWISEKTDALKKRARIIKALGAIAAVFILVSLSYLTVKQIGIWENSIKLWNYSIEKTHEREPLSFYSRALAYDEMGQFERAIEDYDRAIALNASFTNAYINRGLDFYETGQLERAIIDFDHAISLNPAHAAAYYNRGLAFDKMGQLDKALADYDQALSLGPYDADAYNNRGRVFSRRGQLDRAIADFDRAISLNPAYSEAYYNRGLVFQRSGQPDKAAQDFMAWKAYSADR